MGVNLEAAAYKKIIETNEISVCDQDLWLITGRLLVSPLVYPNRFLRNVFSF
jgi:hypothetical protein